MAWDGSARLLAIVRYRVSANLAAVVDAVRRGGIEQVEITLDTPGALEVVEAEQAAGRPVGLGTVVSAHDVKAAAGAGAAFVVGPATTPEMVGAAVDLGVDAIPGALTPTEILFARHLGATAVKLFPAPVGGPAYVRALRGPIPDVPFVTTGGMAIDDVHAYLDAGATCVGLGGELVGRTPPSGDDDLEAIVERAARALAATRA